MKEELQSKLVEILTSIQAAAGKTADFAMEQLPDIAQSYIAYGRAWHTVSCILTLIGLAASVLIAWSLGFGNKSAINTRKGSLYEGDWLAHRVIAALGGSVCAFVMSMSFAANVGEALLVWVAPKVWLLKELAALAK